MDLKRLAIRSAVGLVFVMALIYLGDWAVWQLRVQAKGGMGTAEIDRVIVASLKGNREEYYADGRATVNCSLSLFPQAGAGACWWIRRHPTVFQRGSHG